MLLLQVMLFHVLTFSTGYLMTRASVPGEDAVPVAHCISLETGMQVCPKQPATTSWKHLVHVLCSVLARHPSITASLAMTVQHPAC